MSKWRCKICGYIYDEDKEGLLFSELPDDWVCPVCGAGKNSFFLESQQMKDEVSVVIPTIVEDMHKLSPMALSALFSNLARGCEKQYKEREAELFSEISRFYALAAPRAQDDEVSSLTHMVSDDLETFYPALRQMAGQHGDRGTLRICTWGEKVTNMLYSLLERYQKEGDAFLKNTEVWVCSVCGFIYVGDKAPELCPVCKVPSWKFDKIERGL